MGGCAKHLQGTWTDQRQGELLREITLNTMVRINTNRSSIPELLRQCAQEGRGHLWHPNKIHSEKSVDFLKMASTATKVWFGRSKRATLFKGTCFKILLLIFACFLETASQDCGGRWHSGAKDLEGRSCKAETSSTKHPVPFANSGGVFLKARVWLWQCCAVDDVNS